jgi:hypothetical protein
MDKFEFASFKVYSTSGGHAYIYCTNTDELENLIADILEIEEL